MHCLEAEVHEKDVLKCIMTVDGEPCVMIDLTTRQQELSASLSGSDTLDGRRTLTSTASGSEPFGWTTLSAVDQKHTSASVLTQRGASTTVHTMKMLLSPVLWPHPH